MEFVADDIVVDIRGKSNAAGLKKDIYYTGIDNIIAIPPLSSNANLISTAIEMYPLTGAFARIEASDMDLSYKCTRLGEGDNHAGFRVEVKAFINGKTAQASALLAKLRNRRLCLIVTEKDGQRVLIHDIILHYDAQVEPKRGYALSATVDVSDEPPYYSGPIVF